MGSGIIADRTDKLLLPVVHGQVSFQQRFATEPSPTIETGVSMIVEDKCVFA